MPNALIRYEGDALGTAITWATMPDGERRRRAVEAARDRDVETLWSLTESWLRLRGKSGQNISPRTIEAYSASVAQLVAAFAAENLLHPSRDAGAIFVRQLEAAGRAASTVQVRLAGARALYRALRWAGATDADPFADVHPARDTTAAHEKRQPYPEADVERLLAGATGDLRLLILLGSRAGLRISEILALTWGDIDLSARRLVVQHGKGDKRRTVPLAGSLHAELTASGPHPDPHARVVSLEDRHAAAWAMRHLCKQAGVRSRGCHALRHSAGTRMMRQTGDIAKVATFLGHASVQTSRIYVHFTDDDVANALDGW